MNKYLTSLALWFLIIAPAFAAQNSVKTKIISVDSREDGVHAVYLAAGVPNEACTHNDRAIIVPAIEGASDILGAALTALTTGKRVMLRVDGCTTLQAGSALTAPKITRLSIYSG